MTYRSAYLCALSITTSTVIICGTILATVPTASGASDTSSTRKDTARKVRAYPARSPSSALGETMVSAQGGELQAGDVGTTGPTIKRGWQSVTLGRDPGFASDLGGVEPLLTGKPLRWTNQGRSHGGVRLVPAGGSPSFARSETSHGQATLRRIQPGSNQHAVSSRSAGTTPRKGYPMQSVVAGRRDGHYQTMARNAAGLCGITSREDLAVFLRLIARESGWRHYGRDGEVLRSSSGAIGLGQIKEPTAQAFSQADIREPWGNLLTSACLLQSYYQKRGSWREAVLDYRSGPSRWRTTREAHAYADNIIGGVE